MALPGTSNDAKHLRALVDMGSNGIRFSISSLQPPLERIMPTLYQHRTGISLYDAQYSSSGERIPIDDKTISAVISSFEHFRTTCQDFGVPDSNITVLATEATRTALNSEEFRGRIKDSLGWNVTMLSKEEEGRVGAMGVASSLPHVKGLMMDLGGGSTQLSWLIKESDRAPIRMPPSGSVSMPYGAAAMTRRLAEAEKASKLPELKTEISHAIKDAYAKLDVPEELEKEAHEQGGLKLYLSGGGFRGWGYVLMSQHPVTPYPIPIINGFRANRRQFLDTDQVQAAAAATLEDDNDDNIFRVSDRRASQVPAVAFLVNVLAEALPGLREIRFCQGGVREGFLYASLPPGARDRHPLVVATQPFDLRGASEAIVGLVRAAVPEKTLVGDGGDQVDFATVFDADLLESFANLVYYHAGHPKDLQTTAALRSTTSGVLAAVHGVSHESRALLALLLRARWNGPIPPNDEAFQRQLELLVASPWTLWWINYLGAVVGVIASVYPAGNVREQDRLRFESRWDRDGKRPLLVLRAVISKTVDLAVFTEEASEIEKVGKKKRWIGGKEGVGCKVAVEVAQGASTK